VPGARLVIVGSGPLEERLRAQVRNASLTDCVLMTGSRDDVQALLPAFDLFVLSSRFEGLSIALVEALAAGVPAVCTRVGGVPEVLDGSNAGLMVPPQQPTQLAAAMEEVLADPRRRATMAAAAVRRAESFDVRESVGRLETIYDRALADA
jgi:glycosyltransferase involved in cell wall biosynthesis